MALKLKFAENFDGFCRITLSSMLFLGIYFTFLKGYDADCKKTQKITTLKKDISAEFLGTEGDVPPPTILPSILAKWLNLYSSRTKTNM